MNITLTEHKEIIKYIDTAVDRVVDKAVDKAVAKYSKETEQHMTDLKTFFTIKMDKALEIMRGRPTEERVREIAQEEIKPVKQEMSMVKKEIGYINKKLRKAQI